MCDGVAPQLMTQPNNTDSGFDTAPTETDEFQCAGFELTEGGVVIYDPANHRAWIKSDVVFNVE